MPYFRPILKPWNSDLEPSANVCKTEVAAPLNFFSLMKHLLLRGTLMLCATLLLFFSFNGCRRDLPESPALPDVRERFQAALGHLTAPEEINFFDFDYLSSTNPNVVGILSQRGDDTLTTALALRLLELNQIHHFSGDLINRFGYPIWDHSEIIMDSSGLHPAVMLPLAKPDERETRAFILAFPSVPGSKILLYSAAKVDSLIQVIHTDVDDLGFKVAAFLNNDEKVFHTENTPYQTWLDSLPTVVSGGLNGGVSDREGNCEVWADITICKNTLFTSGAEDRDGIPGCYTIHVCICCGNTGGNDGSGSGDYNFTGSTPGSGGGGGGLGGGGNPNQNPGDQVDPITGITPNFANFWSDCNDVMDGEIDPSDPELSAQDMTTCQQLFFLQSNLLLTPPQLENISKRPALLQAIYNFIQSQGTSPSNMQFLTSMYLYLQNGWMTEEQVVDVLTHIRDKVPPMKKLMHIQTTCNLTQAQFQWLLGEPNTVDICNTFLEENNEDMGAIGAVKSLVDLEEQGVFPNVGPQHVNITPSLFVDFVLEYAFVKAEHPDWGDTKVYLAAMRNVVMGTLHTALDICGLIPAGGEPCDLVNGVLYICEGDAVNAGLSFAAAIPGIGWAATGAKYAGIVVLVKGVAHTLEVKKVGAIFEFGNRADLRTVMGITDATKEAHHIIPWTHSINPLVQKAADSKKAFHMNHAQNGRELEKFRLDTGNGTHGNHPKYNEKVKEKMDLLWSQLQTHYGVGNVSPDVAKAKLIELQNSIGAHIDANPTIKINDLTLNGVNLPSVP